MRLIILDPNLVDTNGHHALYDRVLTREASQRGMEPRIIANRAFGDTQLAGVPVSPLLETTCYKVYSDDSVFGVYEDVEKGNEAVFAELSALPHDFFEPSDLVVVHTVSQITVLGLIDWIATLPVDRCPQFCIWLMLPAGIGFDADGAIEMETPATALCYREAFRRVQNFGLDVTFFGTGAQHARQFSALSKQTIPSHPLLTGFDEIASDKTAQANQVLLFGGDAKIDKGLGVLPELVQTICPKHPDHRFIIHANPAPAWGRALAILEELKALALDHSNLDLRLSPLPPQDYVDLISEAGIILLPYNPVDYRNKSSGITWEAIESESLLVVPQNTWLSTECAYWEAAFQAFSTQTPAEIAVALNRAITGYDKAKSRITQAAQRFRDRNGCKALVDLLVDHAFGGGGDLLYNKQHQRQEIAAPAFEGSGWYAPERFGETTVRWSAQQAQILLTFPGIGTWDLVLSGPHRLDPAQLRDVALQIDGVALPTECQLTKTGAWVLKARFQETRIDMPRREIGLSLNWARKPEGENREIGVLAEKLVVQEVLEGIPESRQVSDKPVSCRMVPQSAVETPDDDGWTRPLRLAGWLAELSPYHDHTIAFQIDGAVPGEEVDQMQIFVNAQPMRFQTVHDTDWQVQIHIPAGPGWADLSAVLFSTTKLRMLDVTRRS